MANISDDRVVAAKLTCVDDVSFRSLLLAMSFTDSSSSSVAVRQALYALTALHLYGYEVGLRYKNKAVGTLARLHSSQATATTKDRLQYIAAGLLLGMFRVSATLLDTCGRSTYLTTTAESRFC
jgi:hypothetical protein